MDKEKIFEVMEKVFLRAPFYSAETYSLAQMPGILSRADFRNALFLASPEFYRVLQKKNFDWVMLGKKEKFSLCKYYNRMSFRATPFGAFSGFTVSCWSETGALRLVEGSRSLLHLLPSREYQVYAAQGMKLNASDFGVCINPTLHKVGKNLRFTRSTIGGDGKMTFLVNEIPAEKLYLHLADQVRKKNVLSRSAIAGLISEKTGCTSAEADDYVTFLVDEQVFLTEYEGSLIEEILIAPDKQVRLRSFQSLIFDEALNLAEDKRILKTDNSLPDFTGNGFYAALERPLQQGGVSAAWQEELSDVIPVLSKLVIPYPTPALKEFTEAFKIKFEGQEVSLLSALDPDTGIDYGNKHAAPVRGELLKDVVFPVDRPILPMEWTAIHRLFFRKWQNNPARSPGDSLIITDADLSSPDLSEPSVPLPPSLAVLFTRTTGKLVLDNNGGASATALTGRFTMFSPEVADLCRQIACSEAEANPEVIFAELHQLSDTHTDNINRRKQIYDYVIPVNTYASPDAEQTILLSDLRLSLRGNELVLTSEELGKRIIPRLPTAYNFHHTELPLFQFLCDLQFQSLPANLTPDLEKLFPGLSFYPRVEYRDIVLCLAKWRLTEPEILDLLTGGPSLGRLHILRQERQIPRLISMGISDQQLVFDMAEDPEALFFLDCLKETKNALIREYLPPDRSVTAGKYVMAAQFVALFIKRQPVYRGFGVRDQKKARYVQRAFLPGSSWIYLKIYCTAEAADLLLLQVIRPFIEGNRRQMQSWFFIRYQDPGPHIRLRILTESTHYGILLTNLHQVLADKTFADLIRDVKQDTYEREIERYSPELMEMAEDSFYMGSRLVMSWLSIKQNEADNGFELASLELVYRMVSLFLKTNGARTAFFQWRADAFIKEFGDRKVSRLDFDRKYRAMGPDILQVLVGTGKGRNVYDRSEEKKQFLECIKQLAESSVNWSDGKRGSLLTDLVHMQVNRLFTVSQRKYEALICYCLYRFCNSLEARTAGAD